MVQKGLLIGLSDSQFNSRYIYLSRNYCVEL